MISKYLIQASSNNDEMVINGYYTLAGSQTLKHAKIILQEFIETAQYSKSIYNKHFRIIKQTEWKEAIRKNNHKLFRQDNKLSYADEV